MRQARLVVWLLLSVSSVIAAQVSVPVGVQQDASLSDSIPTFSATTNLVLVDAEIYDTKTGKPITEFVAKDFQLFDNGREVPIAALDTGSFARPIALWFAVLCNEQGRGELSSAGFLGKEAQLRPALERLEDRDRIGVAQWCDNGNIELFPPTADRGAAVAALNRALRPIDFSPIGAMLRRGELTLQEMVRTIVKETKRMRPAYLPIIVFLHGDWTGAPQTEIDDIISDLLESRGIVYGIKNTRVPTFINTYPGEMSEILHYIAENTSGEYFAVKNTEYGVALETIIDRVHFRYQLSFRPSALDGKRHRLRVQLSDDARRNFKHARIRARYEYVAPRDRQ